jgi:hypothetical protein
MTRPEYCQDHLLYKDVVHIMVVRERAGLLGSGPSQDTAIKGHSRDQQYCSTNADKILRVIERF